MERETSTLTFDIKKRSYNNPEKKEEAKIFLSGILKS